MTRIFYTHPYVDSRGEKTPLKITSKNQYSSFLYIYMYWNSMGISPRSVMHHHTGITGKLVITGFSGSLNLNLTLEISKSKFNIAEREWPASKWSRTANTIHISWNSYSKVSQWCYSRFWSKKSKFQMATPIENSKFKMADRIWLTKINKWLE